MINGFLYKRIASFPLKREEKGMNNGL